MFNKYLIILLVSMVTEVFIEAFSYGAPPEGCNEMVPNHGGRPQKGSSPYSVQLSTSTYTAGEEVTVTLSGKKGKDFLGFLIQARTEVTKYNTVGVLKGDTTLTSNNCEESDASLTHFDNSKKSSLDFTWTAPNRDVGPVTFVYTVVKNYEVYWTKMKSETITFLSKPTEGDSDTETGVTGGDNSSAGGDNSDKEGDKSKSEENETSTKSDISSSTKGAHSETGADKSGEDEDDSKSGSTCLHLFSRLQLLLGLLCILPLVNVC